MAPARLDEPGSYSQALQQPSRTKEDPFSSNRFDPIEYLNGTLPPLAASTAPRQPGQVSLAELSSQAQALLTQINAQSARLSNTLTQLTDEILRGGGRLAYEVEVLRGDTISLSETLTDNLQDEVDKFVPTTRQSLETQPSKQQDQSQTVEDGEDDVADPSFITNLRSLSLAKSRLESVIQTFGEAMEWPLAPSEVSITSSFISVSAPEPGSDSHSREEKGREVAAKIRKEIGALLDKPDGGIEAATEKVEALRDLAEVWKGTAEEKARTKFVDGLGKLVEDRRKIVASDQLRNYQRMGADSTTAPNEGSSSASRARDQGRGRGADGGGGGFMRNLQRLREEIYLD